MPTSRTVMITAMLLMGLSACSQTLRMQAASVTRLADGSEWVLTGDIQADIQLSSLTRLAGDGIACDMPMDLQLDRSGAGTMTCRDASGAVIYSQRQTIPAGVYGTSVRGTYVDTIDTPRGPGRMAFGWGSFADPDYLRTLLDQNRAATGGS